MKRMFRNFGLFSVFCLIFLLSSCDKKNECEDSVEAKLVNMTGFDGCGWVIELNNGNRLEPRNLGDFDIELENNKEVYVTYQESEDFASICMIGPIVVISCIEER